jgi:Fic family protein
VGEILQRQEPPAAHRAKEVQEVRNAAALMANVAERLQRDPAEPMTEALIQHFHELLTQGIDYPNNTPGRYRTHAVQAGDYQPPADGEAVRRLMAAFVAWMNSPEAKALDPVVRAIAAHFQLVSIHPFGDGNGRVSRAVESFLLYQAGINARGYYSLANFYYRQRPEYIYWLDYVRFQSDPDLTPFVTFALKGLLEELQAVHAEVLGEVRIIAFRDFARETLVSERKLGSPLGGRLLEFLTELDASPVSVRDIRAGRHPLARLYRGLADKTLQRDLAFLRAHQLVLIDGDELRANLGIMTQFTVLHAPQVLG